MTREELKHLALDAGFRVAYVFPGDWLLIEPMGKGCAVELERFYAAAYAAGAAAEREACAKVCEDDESGRDGNGYYAAAIRARGEK